MRKSANSKRRSGSTAKRPHSSQAPVDQGAANVAGKIGVSSLLGLAAWPGLGPSAKKLQKNNLHRYLHADSTPVREGLRAAWVAALIASKCRPLASYRGKYVT